MLKQLQVLLLLVCLSSAASAQFKVEGDVRDTDGQPLVGATILIKGRPGGASSNANGHYSLTLPDKNSILIISFLGYEAQEVAVNGRAVLNIQLSALESELRSVVVTALGVKRQKSSLGYAVSELAGKDVTGYGETNPISSLAGKMAGVQVSGNTAGPTGSTRIVIRGIRELQGGNQPLYVIDGVPAVNGNMGAATQWGGFDLGDGLSDLNPNDVESISVLKGASAAALYGSRALNGVILITTKNGRSRKGLGIELNSSLTVDKVSTKLDEAQTTYGQGSSGLPHRDATTANNITSNWGPRFTDLDSIIQRDGTMRPYKYIPDNAEGFFRAGLTAMNTISVSGGNERSSLRASYSNVSSRDIAPKSDFSRNNFSIRAESKVTDKLTIEAKGSLMVENVSNRPALTDEVNNIGNGLLALVGNFDQSWLQEYQNADGSYINYTGDQYRANPYWTLNRTVNESRKQRVGGSLMATYTFSPQWSASINAGTDFYNFNFENFLDKYTPAYDGGFLLLQDIKTKEDNYQAMVNFNTRLGKDLQLSVMAGGNIMKYNLKQITTEGKEIIVPAKNLISNFSQLRVIDANPRKEIQSVFGSAQFNYKDALYLTMQARNDWSSTLPEANHSYFYPSVDLSWVVSNSFKLEPGFVNYAKIRTALGQVGGDTDPYQLAFAYSLTGLSLNGNPMGEVLGDIIPNASLLPQRKTSFEIGTDIGLFNDRVGIDFTYYNEKTKDAIVTMPIPQTSGYGFAILNAGTLRNSGVEILIRTTPVRIPNGLRWDLSFNYAKNNNTIVALSDELAAYPVAEARWAGATITAEKGKPFGTIIGLDFLRNDKGQRIIGSDGFPQFTDGPVELGNTLPDWTGGITNTFSWKGLELKAVVDIRVGGDLFSMTNMTMYMKGKHANTVEGRDSWNEYQQERRAEEDANRDPSLIPQNNRGYIAEGVLADGSANNKAIDPAQYWNRVGSATPRPFIYDGGYVKLRDLGLNYTLPRNWHRKLPVQQITVGAIGRNLWIIHKNTPNIDPESNYNNGNGQGFEYGSLPGRKRYGFNVLIKL